MTHRFLATLVALSTLALPVAHAAPPGARTVKLGKAGTWGHDNWNRFTTKNGRDLNLRLDRGQGGRVSGRVILGSTAAGGDRTAFKGGAGAHVLDVDVQQKP